MAAASGAHVFAKSANEVPAENMKLQLAIHTDMQAKGGSVMPLALSLGAS